jgi:dodecin
MTGRRAEHRAPSVGRSPARAIGDREAAMNEHVYRITELVGTSTTSVGDAIQNAVSVASQTLRNLEWFEVGQIRGHIADGKINHYQVTVKIGFRYQK